MILLDANLLVYAHIKAVPQHAAARQWLDGRLAEESTVGFPWESITAFLRVTTNPRILERPLSIGAAWQQVEEWLSSGAAWVPQATPQHAGLLRELLMVPGLRANDVADAHLAALAIEHGLTLCSADSGFARFPKLRWLNPLAH